MKMKKRVLSSIIIGILLAIFAVIGFVSLALSVVAVFKLHPYTLSAESVTAVLCNGVPLSVSVFTLLFVTLPAGIVYCTCNFSKDDDESVCCSPTCCIPTYYASVIMSGSSAVIGTVVAGILQIFSVTNYEEVRSNHEVASFARAAAALNFTAAAFGVVLIAVTFLIICLADEEKWYCSKESTTAFIFVNILLVSSLVVALLTIISSFSITNFSEEGGFSTNSTRATVAALFSGGAAGCLFVGFCIGGPYMCYTDIKENTQSCTSRHVLGIWGLLLIGFLISGGLMIAVGRSFSSDEELATDVPLNRGSIATMGYLVGALNFVTLLFAVVSCSVCPVCWVKGKISGD